MSIPTFDELLSLHERLHPKARPVKLKFANNEQQLSRGHGAFGIYTLLCANYPVYVGRSIDPASRARQHISAKDYDYHRVLVARGAGFDVLRRTRGYVEAMCYYYYWSLGYCTFYNSTEKWNWLPLLSQSGPALTDAELLHAHAFLREFAARAQHWGLVNPERKGEPKAVRYCGNRSTIGLSAICWRPDIPPALHPRACERWDQKRGFNGALSYVIQPGTLGEPYGRSQTQRPAYDILRKIGVIRVSGTQASWHDAYPFPHCNLPLCIIAGAKDHGRSRTQLEVQCGAQWVSVKAFEPSWRDNAIF